MKCFKIHLGTLEESFLSTWSDLICQGAYLPVYAYVLSQRKPIFLREVWHLLKSKFNGLWKWGDQGKKAGAHLVRTEIEFRKRQVMGMPQTTSTEWAVVLERLIHHLQQIQRPLSKWLDYDVRTRLVLSIGNYEVRIKNTRSQALYIYNLNGK